MAAFGSLPTPTPRTQAGNAPTRAPTVLLVVPAPVSRG